MMPYMEVKSPVNTEIASHLGLEGDVLDLDTHSALFCSIIASMSLANRIEFWPVTMILGKCFEERGTA